jgi:hypothetical protein
MYNKMKNGKTEMYRQVWEIQTNTDTYRLKMWRQRFVDLRMRNSDNQIEESTIDA